MRRLRSVAVVALLWLAALAGSSAPGGIHPGVAGSSEAVSRAAPSSERAERDGHGKRWALREDPAGKRWCAGGPHGEA